MVLGRKACHTPPGGGGIPYNGLYPGVVLPEFERGSLFRLQVYERLVIPPAGKSVFSVSEKAQIGQQMHFMSVKKSRKTSGFLIYSILNLSSWFTAVKRSTKF